DVDLRQAIEQVPGAVAGLDARSRPQHCVRVEEDTRLGGPDEGDDDPRVTVDVGYLDVAAQMSADEVVAVQTDPHHGDLRCAVRVDRAHMGQRSALDEIAQLLRQCTHGASMSDL